MNDTNEIKSIWDGWEKQIFGLKSDGRGGFCAMGWAYMQKSPGPSFDAITARVGRYVQSTMNPPDIYHVDGVSKEYHPSASPVHAIIWANNTGQLNCDQFREIDRLTQIEAVSKPLIDSAEIAVGVGR